MQSAPDDLVARIKCLDDMSQRFLSQLLPAFAAVLMLCGTQLFPALLNPTLRWLYIVIIAGAVVLTPGFLKVMKLPMTNFILVFLAWCFLTALWSEIPRLTFYKALAASSVMLPLFLGGVLWASYQQNLDDIWRFFRWLIPAALLVALSGRAGQGLLEQGQNYYSGLAGNSNFLGWMMSVIFVPLFWSFMHRRGKSTSLKGIMYTAALLLSLYYLLITQSRGAMLTTAFTAACYFFSTSSGRRSKILATLSLVLMVCFLTIPNFGEFVYQKFIIKGSGTDISGSWELSRASIFEATWAGAEGGGFFGGGYGISIGSDPSEYSGGFTSVGYGREKGNAILAVIEETGLIGLLILLSMFIHFFTKAHSAYKKSLEKSHKIQLGLLVGYAAGMLIMSNFEAWLVSPGSPESLFFWVYLGVIYGFCLRIIRDYDYSVGVDVINGRKYA